jgi:hypothetical protein
LEYIRKWKAKDRVLRRIMDDGLRLVGLGFRQGWLWMVEGREAERRLVGRQRGVVRRICDRNVRVMGEGFRKLGEEARERRKWMGSRLRFEVRGGVDC